MSVDLDTRLRTVVGSGAKRLEDARVAFQQALAHYAVTIA